MAPSLDVKRPAASPPPPRDAPRFAILGRVAPAGVSLGVTYRALDRPTGREVVIRTLPVEPGAGETRRDRFLYAVRRWAALEHPRIVPVLAHGLSEGETWAPAGAPYVVTLAQPGGDLRDALRREGRLAEPAALAVAAEIAGALEVAHRAGVVHGGLEPGCVLLDGQGAPNVADFGLAVAAGTLPDAGDAGYGSPGASAAASDAASRPSPYRAPEQPLGTVPDGRVDLWSLGVLLYELLTGRLPSDSDSLLSLALPPPQGAGGREVLPLLLPSTGAVLLQALARTPDGRFRSATEMHAALLHARELAVEAGSRPAAPGETTALLMGGVARYRAPAPSPAAPVEPLRGEPDAAESTPSPAVPGAAPRAAPRPPTAPLPVAPPRRPRRVRSRLALILIPLALILLALLALAVSPAGAPAAPATIPGGARDLLPDPWPASARLGLGHSTV